MSVRALHRTLDQELSALLRGVSLECLVCGEFVLHGHASIVCPECGTAVGDDTAAATAGLQLRLQAG